MADAFDIEVAMEYVDGDHQLMGELVSGMLAETPLLMERIGRAIKSLDHESLRLEAHMLKGSVAMLGATDVVASAAKLESLGSPTDLEGIEPLHAELQSRIGILMDGIEKYCGDNSDI